MANVNITNGMLEAFMQDANGADTYDATRAIFTHLEAGLHFVIPHDVNTIAAAHADWNCDLTAFGSSAGANQYVGMDNATRTANSNYRMNFSNLQIYQVIAINYRKLIAAGLESADAWVVSALRSRWLQLGCLKEAINSTQTLEAEHNVLAADGTGDSPESANIANAVTTAGVTTALDNHSANFRAEFLSEEHGYKWIVKHAENIWAAVECVFKLRGHHMKTTGNDEASFVNLYTRIMTAAYEGNFESPRRIKFVHLYRTSIHCFLIKALPTMTSKFIAYNKVGASTVMRLSSGPCGCAQVTTAAAALDTMSGEVWFNTFKQLYTNQVEEAIEAKDVILRNKYSYHIAAGLYGQQKLTTVTIKGTVKQLSEVISSIQSVAAACQGMINALEAATKSDVLTGFALRNAKALTKAASAAPLLALRVRSVVEASIDDIVDAKGIDASIKAAFPSINVAPPVNNAQANANNANVNVNANAGNP